MRACALILCLFTSPALAAELCAEWPYDAADPRLEDLVDAFHNIDDALPELTRAAHSTKPDLCLTTGASEALGTYDRDTSAIALHDTLSPAQTKAILLHELRHLDQAWRGACLSPGLSMHESARAVFALEADAMAIAHLAAWTLAQKGQTGPLDALKHMPQTADIAAAFQGELDRGGTPSDATAAAFSAWYRSDTRREIYYLASCEAYLSTLEESKQLPSYDRLDDDFLGGICRLPDGAAYDCAEPAHALPRGEGD